MELFYFFKMFFINYLGVFMYLYELFDCVFFFFNNDIYGYVYIIKN